MKKKHQPLVSIAILNWNGIKDTMKCLESVSKLSYKNFETIVVDNGSEKDESRIELRKVRNIILLENKKNKGFTGGHLDALNVANGKYILLLNNDAIIDSNYLDIAIEKLEADPKIAAIGGKSYVWDGKEITYDKGGPFFGFQNVNHVTAEAIFSNEDTLTDQIVDNLSGSGVVIRKGVVDELGYLYKPFFAYYEETDLFARMARAGYKITYSPDLNIWHKGGASSSSYFQYYQLFKNRFLFALRNFETGYIVPFLKSYVVAGLKASIKRVLRRGDSNLNRAFSNAFIYNMFFWPKSLVSRLVLSRDKHLITGYNSILRHNHTYFSLVVDFTKEKVNNSNQVIEKISNLRQKYGNRIDFVIVSSIKNKVNINGCNNIFVTENYRTKTRDLGWLSAKYDYIAFCNIKNIPDLNQLTIQVQKMMNRNLWMDASGTKTTIYHRDLLLNNGGFSFLYKSGDEKNQFCVANYLINRKYVNLSKSEYKTLCENLGRSCIDSIKKSLFAVSQVHEPSSSWEQFLSRHYRVYQLRNLLKWLISPGISTYLKLARIKNLILNIFKRNRKGFAVELKHIRNEVLNLSGSGQYIAFKEELQLCKIEETIRANSWQQIPVFIICRDKVSMLTYLLRWLEKAGMQNIVLIDNDSRYQPLLNLYNKTSYQVIKTQRNIGHKVPWDGGVVRALANQQVYIVTDPDVVPDEKCPKDFLKYFLELHKKYPNHQKIGLGLRIDNLPDHFHLKRSVIEWEGQFWRQELEKDVYESAVDTTFALYKPLNYNYFIHTSIRTGPPYVARHLPWYTDSSQLTVEEIFYRQRASSQVTTWSADNLDERYLKELGKLNNSS